MMNSGKKVMKMVKLLKMEHKSTRLDAALAPLNFDRSLLVLLLRLGVPIFAVVLHEKRSTRFFWVTPESSRASRPPTYHSGTFSGASQALLAVLNTWPSSHASARFSMPFKQTKNFWQSVGCSKWG